MATIKQFGIAGVGSDVQLGKNGGRLVYNSGSGRFDFFESDGATLEVVRVGELNINNTSTVNNIDNDPLLTANSNVRLSTQQSVKRYVDKVTGNGGMKTAGDTGSGAIIFETETFTLNGNANAIVTRFVGTNSFLVSLRNEVTIANTLIVGSTGTGQITATNYSGNVDAITVNFDNLTGTGAVIVTDILDEDDLVTDSNTALATQQSIKKYVDDSLASGGLAMSISDTVTTETFTFATDTFNIIGTANQVSSTLLNDTFTIAIVDEFIAPSNLTVTNNLTTSLTAASVPYIGTGGLLTEDTGNIEYNVSSKTFTVTNLKAGTIAVSAPGSTTISNILNENSLVSNSQTALATQASIKAYVDTEIDKVDALIVNAGGSTQGTVDLYAGQELTVNGTLNEIETNMSAQTLTIGLPNDVSVNGNLSVGGSLLSNDITAEAITIDGDATVTGNLSVQGTTTIVDSTTVQIADAAIRVNSDGGVVSAGLEANIAGVIESVLYNPATSRWELSGNVYTGENLTVVGIGDFGTVEFDNLSGTGAVNVTDISNATDLGSGSASDSNLVTQLAVKTYIDAATAATEAASNLVIQADGLSEGTVNLFTETLSIVGGTNITSNVDTAAGNVVTIALDDIISLSNVSAANVIFTNLIDGAGDAITAFITEADGIAANDNDTSVPTTAAIIDFVDNNAGDGLTVRGAVTADSILSNTSIGNTPAVTSRTYYAVRFIINVSTPFSGGNVNHIVIAENNGAGNVLVAEADCDITTAGTYIVEQTAVDPLTKNAGIQVKFLESNGTTEAVPTAGSLTATLQYVWQS